MQDEPYLHDTNLIASQLYAKVMLIATFFYVAALFESDSVRRKTKQGVKVHSTLCFVGHDQAAGQCRVQHLGV